MKSIEIVFGKVVRQLREKSGVSQEDFAEIAGIHRTYVSSIELGKVQISIAIAQKVAVALNVPLSKIWKQVEAELAKS
jgi:transcriptional regulator with XRE-family HTH domain